MAAGFASEDSDQPKAERDGSKAGWGPEGGEAPLLLPGGGRAADEAAERWNSVSLKSKGPRRDRLSTWWPRPVCLPHVGQVCNR